MDIRSGGVRETPREEELDGPAPTKGTARLHASAHGRQLCRGIHNPLNDTRSYLAFRPMYMLLTSSRPVHVYSDCYLI